MIKLRENKDEHKKENLKLYLMSSKSISEMEIYFANIILESLLNIMELIKMTYQPPEISK